MSLYGYKKKHKPALWIQSRSPGLASQLSELKQAKRAAEKLLKRDRALKKRIQQRAGWTPTRKPRSSWTPKRKHAAAESRAYNDRVKEWLKDKMCVACLIRTSEPGAVATQCHHKHGRRGALLLYEPLWLPVCADCHDWIHRNIAAARELGLYAPAGQWNRMPP